MSKKKVEQRRLLGDTIATEGNLEVMKDAAEKFETLKDEDPLNGFLNGLVGGGQDRKKVDNFARDAVEFLKNDTLVGITFAKDEEGNTLDPMVVLKDGKELDTKEKTELFGKGNTASDRIQKIVWYATVIGSATNKNIDEQRKSIEENTREHCNAVIEVINKIPSVKTGMLYAIREEFPLKALFEAEEAMALAQYNCDPKVLNEIFKDSEGNSIKSYEEIEDKLEISEDNKGNLALVYKAGPEDEMVPIAQLEARSNGKGYSNSFKFTLKVHDNFKGSLKKGNKAAYGDSGGIYESFYYIRGYTDMEYLIEMAKQV